MTDSFPTPGKRRTRPCTRYWTAFIAERTAEFATQRTKVMTSRVRTVRSRLRSGETRDKLFQTEADDVVVNDAYRRAARILSPDIARTYVEVLAKRKPEAKDDFEDALIEAREDIAALGLMETCRYPSTRRKNCPMRG